MYNQELAAGASADTDDGGTADVTFAYDALGRRVCKTTATLDTVFVQAGQQVIVDYTAGAAATSPREKYVYASYIDEPILKDGTLASGTGIVYYHRNQQYSVTALTDASGSVIERYAYDSHGALTILDASGTPLATQQSPVSNRITYTGRELDIETNLYHFRARLYSPTLGRFVNRDPLGYVDGMSLYRGYFARSQVDPYGENLQDLINGGGCVRFKKCEVKAGPAYIVDGKIHTGEVKFKYDPRSRSEVADFEMAAVFVDAPERGVFCFCCEVRQFIRWDKAFHESPTKGPNEDQVGPIPGQDEGKPGVWYEDRTSDGNDQRYGHRFDEHTIMPLNRGHDRYLPRRADGCAYLGFDKPGAIPRLYARTAGKWEFQLRVVDVCNGERVVKTSDVISIKFPHRPY